MIKFCDEQPFNGKCGTYFEAYMFATTSKHIARHVDFEDMVIEVLDNGTPTVFDQNNYDMSDVLVRKAALNSFNKQLRAGPGIDINSDANKLRMCIIYIGVVDESDPDPDWHKEFEEVKKALYGFSKDCGKVVAFATHFHQMNNDGFHMNYPHVHVIYNPSSNNEELWDYLQG